jgi:hypothetical protein
MKKVNVSFVIAISALLFFSASAYSMGIESYKLYRAGDNNCRWDAPNGETYTVYCGGSQDQSDEDKMILDRDEDGVKNARLILSLEGTVGATCSLFSSNGSVADYLQTVDIGMSTPQEPVFILEKEGDVSTPLAKWTTLNVVCVKL